MCIRDRSNACRAVRAIHRSSGRGRDSPTAGNTSTDNTATGNATASNIPGSGSDRAARRRAGGCRSAPGSDPVAADHRARSRESGANHRTAQGEPAANGQRQFKSHRGAQGYPGRDETLARKGFRADPAQGVTASGAAGSGPAQARTDVSAAAGESAAQILPEGVDVRRLVAVGAVIIETLVLQQRPTRYRTRRTVWDTIQKKHGAK